MTRHEVSAFRLRRRELLALTAAAATAAIVRAPGAALAQPAGLLRRTLPNGMTVIVDERRTAESVALQVTARAGSRDDGMQQPGINALTSRLMFTGTRRYQTQTALLRAASLVGGVVGRNSTTEQSFFTALVPATEVDTGFELLSELVLNPLLGDGALTALKQTTLQDLAQRQADPGVYLGDLFLASIFAGHPAGTPILGTMESIQGVTRDALASYYARMWAASNLILTVVGRIDAEEAFAKAGQYFGGAAAGTANQRQPVAPRPRDDAESVRGAVGQAQTQFRIGFLGPSLGSDDRFPMQVLSTMMSNRIFIEVRSERGLAYSANAGSLFFTDAGAWFAFAGVEPANFDAAADVIRGLITQLRDDGADPREVAFRIGQITGAQVLADETNAARAGRVASAEALGDVSLEEFVRRIRAVSAADVQRVARTYLDLDRALTVVVGPRAQT